MLKFQKSFNTNNYLTLTEYKKGSLTAGIFFTCCLLFGLLLLNTPTAIKNQQSFGVTVTNPISLKKLDYDTGDLSQWQCKEYAPPTNNLQIVKSPVKQGTYSLKTTLKDNAVIVPNTNGERAEMKYCDSPGHAHLFKSSDDLWIGWYTDFSSSNFTIPNIQNAWHVWTQWHGTPETTTGLKPYGLPISFNLNNNLLNLRINTNLFDQQNPACTSHIIVNGQPNTSCGYLWAKTIQKGHWYKIVLHTRWSNTTNGLVEGTIDDVPIKTFHGVLLNPNGSEDTVTFLKQGLYRNKAINVLQQVYHDGTVIAKCPTNAKFDLPTLKCISP